MASLFTGLLNAIPLPMPGRRASTLPDPKAAPTHAQAVVTENDGRPQLLKLQGYISKEGSKYKTWQTRQSTTQ